jgi:hypothetical protein
MYGILEFIVEILDYAILQIPNQNSVSLMKMK